MNQRPLQAVVSLIRNGFRNQGVEAAVTGTREHSKSPVKLRVQPEYFEFLLLETCRHEEESLSWQEKLVLITRGGRAALTKWGQADHVWHPGDPLGCLWVLLYLNVMVKGRCSNSVLRRACDQEPRALRDKGLGHATR